MTGMDFNVERIVRYGLQIVSCDGQPFFMQSLWVPEKLDGSMNWGGIFRGPVPLVGQREFKQIPFNSSDPHTSNILVWRD